MEMRSDATGEASLGLTSKLKLLAIADWHLEDETENCLSPGFATLSYTTV